MHAFWPAREMFIPQRPQPFQFGVDGGGAGEVGVEGGLLGVHCGLRVVIDDATMNALFDQEAKLFLPDERQEPARKTRYLINKSCFVNL
jgi:hypothetical protein